MSLHEPCEEVGVHRTKLDKIFEDKLPALSNCIKEMGSRCHDKREAGDKDLDKRKLNARYFYVIIGALIGISLFSLRYTYSEAQTNAEAHGEYTTTAEVEDHIDEKVDPLKEKIGSMQLEQKEQSIKLIEIEIGINNVLNAVKNLER